MSIFVDFACLCPLFCILFVSFHVYICGGWFASVWLFCFLGFCCSCFVPHRIFSSVFFMWSHVMLCVSEVFQYLWSLQFFLCLPLLRLIWFICFSFAMFSNFIAHHACSCVIIGWLVHTHYTCRFTLSLYCLLWYLHCIWALYGGFMLHFPNFILQYPVSVSDKQNLVCIISQSIKWIGWAT